MYLLLNLLTKRVTNVLFVSNNCSKFLCFHSFLLSKQMRENCLNNKLKQNNRLFSNFVIKRHFSDYNSENDLNDNKTKDLANNENQKLSKSFETKFKTFTDEDSEVILDVNEELITEQNVPKEWKESEEEIHLYQKKIKRSLKDLDLKRGITGVFDLEELVQLLRSEGLKDIAVIKVPEEYSYCQYLVLANGRSKRHTNAFFEYFNKVYKMKKYRKDPFLEFGGKESLDWKVVDMKNIVLHVFSKSTREYYDIETLWTVGQEFDDKTQIKEKDSVVDIMEKHIKFLQEMKPSN